jgi:methionyl aminopeptidase
MIAKNRRTLEMYRDACKISLEIMASVRESVAVGITTSELNKITGEECQKRNVKPAFYKVRNHNGIFGHNACIYKNDVAVHGIPDSEPLASGDLLTYDFGIIYKGLHTDHCYTVGVGDVSKDDRKLLEVGKLAVVTSIKQAVAGNYTGDIGNAIEEIARMSSFDTLKEYIGHGIGKNLHEVPEIPAHGEPGKGEKLKENMIICVEAQVTAGSAAVYTDKDSWSVRTKDGSNCVMFEYMVRVGREEPEILTDNRDWAVTI